MQAPRRPRQFDLIAFRSSAFQPPDPSLNRQVVGRNPRKRRIHDTQALDSQAAADEKPVKRQYRIARGVTGQPGRNFLKMRFEQFESRPPFQPPFVHVTDDNHMAQRVGICSLNDGFHLLLA